MTRMIRRLLCLTLAALMLTALLPSAVTRNSAKAETSLGVVVLDGVNFRMGPSMKDKQLFRIAKGTVCAVLATVNANEYTWYQCTARDPDSGREHTGYIRGDCFRMMSESEVKNYSQNGNTFTNTNTNTNNNTNYNTNFNSSDDDVLGYVMTIKGSVNVRAAIGGSSLTQVGIYETFPYLLAPVRRGNYTWYFIQLSSGLKGYVRGDCVKLTSGGGSNNNNSNNNNNNNNNSNNNVTPIPDTPTGYVTTTMDNVNVRKGVWGDLWFVAKKAGASFPYYGQPRVSGKTKWYLIKVDTYDGKTYNDYAYIHGGFVTATETNPQPDPTPVPDNNNGSNNNTVTATGYVTTTMDDVNVRSSAWGDQLFVAKKAGTTFPYYGEPTVSGKTKWYRIKVDTYNGKTYNTYAYIHGSFVTATETNPQPTPDNNNTNNSTNPNSGNKNEATYTTLRYGSKGTAVSNLVQELKNQGFYSGSTTNVYNSVVEKAVTAFQKAKGLKVDGIAGSETQHTLFNTVPVGEGNRSNLAFDTYPVEKIDWYTGGINELWPRGSNFKIKDVQTGLVWWAHRWAGGLHVDAEPLTAADTAILCKIYGVNKASEITEKTHWQRRPCLVTIGTRTFACSLYGVPHNPDGDTISTNNFTGQLCIHFTNSKTHGSKNVDSLHQEAIEKAYQSYWGSK